MNMINSIAITSNRVDRVEDFGPCGQVPRVDDAIAHREQTAEASSFQNNRGPSLSLMEPSSPEPRDGQAPVTFSSPLKKHQLEEGARRRGFILRAREMKSAGSSWNEITRILKQSSTTLIRWMDQVACIAEPTAADCAPQNHKAGRPRKYARLTAAEQAAIQSTDFNRNYKAVSIPQAVRHAIAEGLLRPEVADAILQRDAAGLPLLTDAQRDQVMLSEAEVRARRSPREAWLDYVQSPGSLMLTVDDETGEEYFYQPGEANTIDDGTINFGCCVDMERPGDKCWEKFGVIVGRFQFIPVADHRTRNILGFSYTARPRDSYRAEDLLATMQTVFAEHGMPRVMFLEHGVSNAHLINRSLELLGVVAKHVHSPHQKVIEKLFDLLWTKLSAMPGQVGRFRGEMEEENRLLMACKRGEKDPRDYFPLLPQALQAMKQAIAAQNAQRMRSQQYGHWIPAEWFARDAAKNTRPLSPSDAWMFSPVITRPLKLTGLCVGTSVQMMQGFSLKFHFSADIFLKHIGREVILHFNPFAPECAAMAVLAKTGEVLGPAVQINRHARFTRRAFGYGLDRDIGHIAAKKNAQALRRAVVAIRTDGQTGAAQAEQRDGIGNVTHVSRGDQGRAEVPTVAKVSRSKPAMDTPRSSHYAADPGQTARQAALIQQLQDEDED